MTPVPLPDPETLTVEFDLLMARAGLHLPPDARAQMLVEFSQLRAEMEHIHALANAAGPRADMFRSIIEGRVEE